MALFLVALTGGIASGKSTVGKLLEEKGALVLESDDLAREVVRRGGEAYREIVEHFGEGVVGSDGEIDRSRLAEIVFNDARERTFLNRVTHPRIFELMFRRLREIEARETRDRVVVLDIPLLVEAGADKLFRFTLVVDALPEEQAERLVRDRGMAPEEAWARIRAQVDREKRLRAADHVINNSGDLDDLRNEVDRAWEAIVKAAADAGLKVTR
jgi:dephospho-CoA kinase